jgi:hypothetical protein
MEKCRTDGGDRGYNEYHKALAETLGEIICSAVSPDAIDILRGILQWRFITTGREAATLMKRIKASDCPVHIDLSENDIVQLDKMERKGQPGQTNNDD